MKVNMNSNFLQRKRKGFILYIVCALAIGLFILILGLSKFKSGAVLQLSKTVTQEKMIVVAQAAINESLAAVKAEINNNNATIGKAVYAFWKSHDSAPKVIWDKQLKDNDLKASSQMASEYLGSKGKVVSRITLYVTDDIKSSGVCSYLGSVRIEGKVSCDGLEDVVTITEQHDLKIVDLSFPFLDKYALFVKTFCPTINTNNKKFVVQGIDGGGNNYSFVYLGNRGYPSCKEYPNGSNGSEHPPVLLDFDFETDKALLGSGYSGPFGFNLVDPTAKELSNNKFFMTNVVQFKDIQDKVNDSSDYQKLYASTKELTLTHKALYDKAKPIDVPFSAAHVIVADYEMHNGDGNTSEIFKALLDDLFPQWVYHYGYTDYNHIVPKSKEDFGFTPPFHGLVPYFAELNDKNPIKRFGGSMPALFGGDFSRPVYVDGPVYVRFFKVGLFDKSTISFNIGDGGFSGSYKQVPVTFPSVSCVWEDPQKTFSGKDVGRIDAMTHHLMSHPVDWLSINNFFYGAGENIKNKDNVVSGGIKGYNVFHYLDEKLRTVSTFYDTAEEFKKERIKKIDGEDILDLDGISVISKGGLDLSEISKYRGKGTIISAHGDCMIGNMVPKDANTCYLKIWLMGGKFFVNENLNSVKIVASLIANVRSGDNSSSNSSQEGGFITKGVKTEIYGNLIIDNLFNMDDKKDFAIIHNPSLYTNDYPVRVSVGTPKSLFVLNYRGKD